MTIQKLKLLIKIIQIKIQILLLRKKLTVPSFKKPERIIIHHGGGWLDAEEVNRLHKEKWGFKSSLGYYGGYHYFIERDGNITQFRKDTEKGAHTVDKNRPHYLNKTSVGICLMGNGQEKDFTPLQYASLLFLIKQKRSQYNIKAYGHRDFSATLCPSDILYRKIPKYNEISI